MGIWPPQKHKIQKCRGKGGGGGGDWIFLLKSESEGPRAACAAFATESIRKGTGEVGGCISR